MSRGILQADVKNHGIVLDPRTKLLLMFTMAVFVLGYTGGEELQFLAPFFCLIPTIAFISAKKISLAAVYTAIYSLSLAVIFLWGGKTSGILNFLILGICGILSRFLPCMMMGTYLVSTTTVSAFTAAMERIHLSEKIIIPLSVMFRFFPTVVDEARSVNAAMKMRDIRLGKAGIFKILEYRIVPLMVCCVKIGEELSAAALTRGLGGTVRRTNICKIGFHVQDWIVILFCMIPFVFLILHFMGISV